MTVITKPFSDQKQKQQKEPLVTGSSPATATDVERGNGGAIPRTRPALLIRVNGRNVDRRQVARIHTLTTTCVLLTSLLMISTCILSGLYYWRQVNINRMKHFKGWCSVPFVSEENEDSYQSNQFGEWKLGIPMERLAQLASKYRIADEEQPEALIGHPQVVNNGKREELFDEHMDLDLENEMYERIEVPDFSKGRKGRFIHDFNLNKTGIVDLEKGRCFLLNLDRSRVLPPSNLFDLVSKMRDGRYDIDTEVIKENYRVVTPPITDIDSMGYFIAKECALNGYPTYRLEKMTSPVFKRSVTMDGQKAVFAEFAGSKISEFNIVNLDAAKGKFD